MSNSFEEIKYFPGMHCRNMGILTCAQLMGVEYYPIVFFNSAFLFNLEPRNFEIDSSFINSFEVITYNHENVRQNCSEILGLDLLNDDNKISSKEIKERMGKKDELLLVRLDCFFAPWIKRYFSNEHAGHIAVISIEDGIAKMYDSVFSGFFVLDNALESYKWFVDAYKVEIEKNKIINYNEDYSFYLNHLKENILKNDFIKDYNYLYEIYSLFFTDDVLKSEDHVFKIRMAEFCWILQDSRSITLSLLEFIEKELNIGLKQTILKLKQILENLEKMKSMFILAYSSEYTKEIHEKNCRLLKDIISNEEQIRLEVLSMDI